MAETEITGEKPGPAPAGRTAKGETERRELPKARQAYARRVAEAKATIPHLYAHEDVDLGDADVLEGADGLLDRVIAACGRALRELPGLNAAYRDAGIELYSRVNVGFSTPGPAGPLLPTVFDADEKSVSEIASERTELASGAAAATLASPALAGGTFTVSATGAAPGVDPIVATGQAGALSVSSPRQAVVLRDGHPRAGRRVRLALGCDARVVLPDEAAGFLARIAELLESDPGAES